MSAERRISKGTNRSNKQKRYKIFCVIVAVLMISLIFGEFNNNRIRMGGLRTTATVTNVEVRNVDNINNDRNEVRHYTTFEYEVNGETIVSVRSRTYSSGTRPHRREGDQVEIYYDGRRPTNFIIASDHSEFGVMFWGLMIVFSGVIGILIYKIRTSKTDEMPV